MNEFETNISKPIKPVSSDSKQSKPDYIKWIAIILCIGFLAFGIYSYGMSKYNQKLNEAYTIGFQNGQLGIISQQTQTGNIAFMSNHTGNITIETRSLPELCGGPAQ